MKTFVYSAHAFDRPYLSEAALKKHELAFTEERLAVDTVHYASGCKAVAVFTSDDCSATVLEKLNACGVRFIALRSVGHDHVDLNRAAQLGIQIANVPEYSPYSVAEHAVAMLMTINRKIVESRLLMQLQDFRLDNLTGFDVHGRTVGVIGTGKIGIAFAKIMNGFGTTLLAYDPVKSLVGLAMGIKYVSLEELLRKSDIVSVHCPLNETTRHMLGAAQFSWMKKGSILINTARGAIINTKDLIEVLLDGHLGAVCLDVFENEKGLFFEDHRNDLLQDEQFMKLRSLKNVLITGHQAFLTEEALKGIASATIMNLDYWQGGERPPYILEASINQHPKESVSRFNGSRKS